MGENMKPKDLIKILESCPDKDIILDINDFKNEKFLTGYLENGADYDDDNVILYVNVDVG